MTDVARAPRAVSSRRLTGRSLLLDRPGAILDVAAADRDADRAAALWRDAARRLLDEVGWGGETLAVRRFDGGVSLALTAPADALYAATELNEAAWDVAAATLAGDAVPESPSATLRDEIAAERRPAVVALAAEAARRGVQFVVDAAAVTVGVGAGSATYPTDEVPAAGGVPWESVRDRPVVLVTGSNGKTTTVRLVAAMARRAGIVAGLSSTDGVEVDGERVLEGDYSGPEGARAVIRDRRVELAVLETARGGLLRRGLPVTRADVACVTNVSADHLGEFGVSTVGELASVKLLVARAVDSRGRIVLNADDAAVVAGASAAPGGFDAPITWFGAAEGTLAPTLARGEPCVVAEHGSIVLRRGEAVEPLAAIADMPLAFGGAATHNVANACAAAAIAVALGIDRAAIGDVLRSFGQPGDNRGRLEVLPAGGAEAIVDYAHNPAGMRTLVNVASARPAARRVLLIGQAGDRDDDAIRELARTAWSLGPDHVVVKEMDSLLRGRERGAVTAILLDEFRRLGAVSVEHGASEMDGVERALAWARPGDQVVLTVHESRAAVTARLRALADAGWTAGDPLPPAA